LEEREINTPTETDHLTSPFIWQIHQILNEFLVISGGFSVLSSMTPTTSTRLPTQSE
jgi:hypothetical protein